MSDSDRSNKKEEEGNEENLESRRKFLKVSVAAGATVAALAAGVGFMPNLVSAEKGLESKLAAESGSTTGEAMIVVIRGAQMDVYQGESKYTSNDASFASSLSSSVRARM
jgi:hypothetical protein